jgi:hypothetical protein
MVPATFVFIPLVTILVLTLHTWANCGLTRLSTHLIILSRVPKMFPNGFVQLAPWTFSNGPPPERNGTSKMLPAGFMFDTEEPKHPPRTTPAFPLCSPPQTYAEAYGFTVPKLTLVSNGIVEEPMTLDPLHLPTLKTLVIENNPNPSDTLSLLFSSPDSSPLLSTLVLRHCRLSKNLLAELKLFLSVREDKIQKLYIVCQALEEIPSLGDLVDGTRLEVLTDEEWQGILEQVIYDSD